MQSAELRSLAAQDMVHYSQAEELLLAQKHLNEPTHTETVISSGYCRINTDSAHTSKQHDIIFLKLSILLPTRDLLQNVMPLENSMHYKTRS